MRIKAVLPNIRTLEITEADDPDIRMVTVCKLILYEHSIGGVSLFFYDSWFDVSPGDTLEFTTLDEGKAWVRTELAVEQDAWQQLPDPLPRTFYSRERPMRSVWTPRGRKVTIPDEEIAASPFQAAMLETKQLLANLDQDTFDTIVPLIQQEHFGKAEVIVQQVMGVPRSEARCVIETLIPSIIGRDQLTLD
jgi:hypothetical protein